jgi:hypothetical protein
VPDGAGGEPGCSPGCGGAGVTPGAAGGSAAGVDGAGALLCGCSGCLSCCVSCGCDAATPVQQLRNTSEAPLRSSQRLLRMDTFDSRSFSFENDPLLVQPQPTASVAGIAPMPKSSDEWRCASGEGGRG